MNTFHAMSCSNLETGNVRIYRREENGKYKPSSNPNNFNNVSRSKSPRASPSLLLSSGKHGKKFDRKRQNSKLSPRLTPQRKYWSQEQTWDGKDLFSRIGEMRWDRNFSGNSEESIRRSSPEISEKFWHMQWWQRYHLRWLC